MSPTDRPKAPAHLSANAAEWYRSMLEQYDLDGPPYVDLLRLAAEALQRAQEAREAIARDGAYLRDRFGQVRPHPAVAVERDSALRYARLVRELGLVDEDGATAPRPPRPAGGRAYVARG